MFILLSSEAEEADRLRTPFCVEAVKRLSDEAVTQLTEIIKILHYAIQARNEMRPLC